MRPGVLFILDGLGDRPIPSLGGRTPLEAAETPLMDRLATRGTSGLVDPLGPGIRVGTHVGAGVLMGLHPDDARRLRRGPVEAAGAGVPLSAGDVAFRCNLATLAERGGALELLDRRAGRCKEGNDALCAALDGLRLDDGVEVTLRPATGHRAVLKLAGEGLSAQITDCDPGDAAAMPAPLPACRALERGNVAAERTANLVNGLLRTAFDRLHAHPVNLRRERQGLPASTGLLTRGAGEVFELRNTVRDAGLRAAVISAECTVLGLARLFEFDTITGPEFTGDTETDLDAKVARAMDALGSHDIVFVHVKGTDLCAHDRLPHRKRAFIERIDASLAPLIARDVPVAVSADHCTDSNEGAHTGDPVPSLMYWPGHDGRAPVHYGEADCGSGSLGRLDASTFLERFLAGP